jgi:hypothetical protein
MKNHRLTIEHALYGLAFLLALGVRLANLGAFPLSNFEAGWALQALELSGRGQGGSPLSLGPNPGYSMLTGLLFFLFGSSNGLARLWPALAGALLVCLPLFFQRELGKKAALILAFGLALDPGLLAVSRQAGSAMPALSFGLLALGAAYRRQAIRAGILGGLALLSGPAVLTGAISLALAWGIARLLGRLGALLPLSRLLQSPGGADQEILADSGEQAEIFVSASPSGTVESGLPGQKSWVRLGLYILAGTVFLVGTLFFRFPQGLGALAGTLTAYLDGWRSPSGVPALHLPLALFFYQPLPLIFGLVGAMRGWVGGAPHSGPARLLSLWAFSALLLPMLFPARQMSDLIWMLVPLWALAAIELADVFTLAIELHNRLIVAGQAALLCVLLAFAWNYMLVMSNANLFSGELAARGFLILLVATLGMGTITTVLVALGWTWNVARQGLVFGVGITLGLYMISAAWGAAYLRPAGAQELWSHLPSPGETDLLERTLADVSEWNTGYPHMLDVVVLADSPAVRWALREWPNVRFARELSPSDLPAAIVTMVGQESPALAARYRGQDFPLEYFPAWGGLLPADLARWLAYREAPGQQNDVILWVRADLFPGNLPETQADAQTNPEDEIGP